MDVSKNRGILPPKMDGENNGKPYEQMDDFGGFPPIFGNTPIDIQINTCWVIRCLGPIKRNPELQILRV